MFFFERMICLSPAPPRDIGREFDGDDNRLKLPENNDPSELLLGFDAQE